MDRSYRSVKFFFIPMINTIGQTSNNGSILSMTDTISISPSINRLKINAFFLDKDKEKKHHFLVPYFSNLKNCRIFAVFCHGHKKTKLVLHLSVKTLMPTDCKFLCWFADSSVTTCKKRPAKYHLFRFDQWTNTINRVWTDRSMTIDQTRFLWSVIDIIDQKYIKISPMDR